tara:strand:- start:3714 stop:4877 length:1164 start_codon:yes stop_codon:yes gene_type:complete
MFATRKRPKLALVGRQRTSVPAYVAPPAAAEAAPAYVAPPSATEAPVAQLAAAPSPAPRPVAEPLLDAIPVKRRERRRRGDMPPFLAHGGNHKAWKSVAQAILSGKLATIMLYGPHGCGKTRGVHDMALNHLGMTVYEVNSSNVEGIERFGRDVRHVTRTKTLLGPRLLLIDDLEGFDESYITKAVELIRERKEGDGPIVITCHNIFDRSLLKLRALTLQKMRMYDPGPHAMASAVRTITNHAHGLVLSYAHECRSNYHQLFLRLRTHAQSQTDKRVGFLETTQALLKGQTSTCNWMRAGEPLMLVVLLHENAMAIAARGEETDELERCARFLDAVSAAERMPMEERLQLIGRTAQIELHTTEVPPLYLSKAFTKIKAERTFEEYAP